MTPEATSLVYVFQCKCCNCSIKVPFRRVIFSGCISKWGDAGGQLKLQVAESCVVDVQCTPLNTCPSLKPKKKIKCKAASGKIWSYSMWNQHQIHVNVKYAHWFKEEHKTKMDKWTVTFYTFNSPSQKTALVALCCHLGVPLSSMLTALSSQLLLLIPTVINRYQLRTDFSLREKQMNCLFYWCLLAVLSFVFLCLISRLQDLWGMDCWYTSFLCSDGSIVLLSKLWHFYLSEDSKSDRSTTACCFPGSCLVFLKGLGNISFFKMSV